MELTLEFKCNEVIHRDTSRW